MEQLVLESQQFKDYLENHLLNELRLIQKSDLHSHAGRGGNVDYIASWAGVTISPPPKSFNSLSSMQEWYDNNIKIHCPGEEGYLKRWEAAFVQASNDNISVLSLSYTIAEIDYVGGIDRYIKILSEFHQKFSPNTVFLPELTFDRACDTEREIERLDEIFNYNWFKSIDICCDEFAQPINNFKDIYRKAKKSSLKLKAHVGEFGKADDVMEAVEVLELDEVHHGIAASSSVQIMNWLANHKIQLNICPTSNIMLGLVSDYNNHPIRLFYDHGIPVTINTDDQLIFNQSVSQEYFNLFNCGLMNADELDDIRIYGLKCNI